MLGSYKTLMKGAKMSLEHKSIFLKLKEYKSNPISEYNKICKFLKKKCYYNYSIYEFLEQNFQYSPLLSAYYIDLENCLKSNNKNLLTNCNKPFETFDENTQELLLDEFLSFCEILMHLQFVTYKVNEDKFEVGNYLNVGIYYQLQSLIKTSLGSICHDIVMVNSETYECKAFKSNAEGEAVAAYSPSDLREAIIYYLGTSDHNIQEKEIRLHCIIDLLEPILQERKELKIIGQIAEYLQLFRHPEVKKEEKKYQWYFNNKEKYIDEIFMMCMFLKEYEITKETLTKFNNLK